MKLMQTSVLSRLKPALFVYNFDLLVDHSIGEAVDRDACLAVGSLRRAKPGAPK
jgi:hypothetical protein